GTATGYSLGRGRGSSPWHPSGPGWVQNSVEACHKKRIPELPWLPGNGDAEEPDDWRRSMRAVPGTGPMPRVERWRRLTFWKSMILRTRYTSNGIPYERSSG